MQLYLPLYNKKKHRRIKFYFIVILVQKNIVFQNKRKLIFQKQEINIKKFGLIFKKWLEFTSIQFILKEGVQIEQIGSLCL